MKIILLIAALLCCASAQHFTMPDAKITPGDVLTTDSSVVCVAGYTQSARHVTAATKRRVLKLYGITKADPGEYEIDHLISLELGGSNDVKNLWPQPYDPPRGTLGAHDKDKVENWLHSQVCSGAMALTDAQKLIASDWSKAYRLMAGDK